MRRIRIARPEDAAEIRSIYRPFVENSHTSFELELPSVEEMSRRISTQLETHPWLVLEEEGAVLGYAYAAPYRTRAAYQWCVEVSVYVREGARRSGVGRALYRALFAVLAHQGYYNAYAIITLPNPASVSIHESLGFNPIGVFRKIGFKNGVWHDVGWWHLALKPHDEAPIPPPPFRKLEKVDVEDILLSSC